MQEHLSNISRETEIQTKNQKKMLVTESTETKMKNVLDEFINRLNTAEERISGLKEKATENSKTEMQRGKKQWKRNEYPRTMGLLQKVWHVHNEIAGKKGTEHLK